MQRLDCENALHFLLIWVASLGFLESGGGIGRDRFMTEREMFEGKRQKNQKKTKNFHSILRRALVGITVTFKDMWSR